MDIAESETEAVAVARLKVERWYRGGDALEAYVRYQTGYLEPVDDCYAAVAVSPMMSPVVEGRDINAQIGADLVAGLADPKRSARLNSLKGLSGLRSESSQAALHEVIGRGDEGEANWATYAALRTGDQIADSAPYSGARKYALAALGENLRASEALTTIAAHLTDPDPGVRFQALNAMRSITRAPACTLWRDDMLEPQISQCVAWWNHDGRHQFAHEQ